MRGKRSYVHIVPLAVLTALIFQSYSILQSRYHNSINVVGNLQEISLEIESLRQKHGRLILRLKQSPGLVNGSTLQFYSLPLGLHFEEQGPAKDYEKTRWRIHSNTKELWYYLSHQIKNTPNETLKLEHRQTILQEVGNRKRSLLSDQERLPALDGHEDWRSHESARVSDLVQRRLHYLQNPRDCKTAKKLVCRHNVGGFGCNTHHLVYCLLVAYGLERTLVLGHFKKANQYSFWWNMFKPLSETCTTFEKRNMRNISGRRDYTNTTVIVIPLGIIRFNSDPYSWWLGQLVRHNLKLRRPDVINDAISQIDFKSPIVGVHVRRTDKIGIEAKYHGLEEYMSHVVDYYDQLELTHDVNQRRVYIATDDASVLKEAIAKYPQYKFYGDYSRAQSADMARNTSQGYTGILVDLHVLAMCDFIVCTFSSNIGRMSYELMQTRRIDAINRVISLDTKFYFTGNEKHVHIAVMRNKNVPFELGDMISYNLNANNGTVLRTNDSGPIPWYKTELQILEHPYPEYKQVPQYTGNWQHA